MIPPATWRPDGLPKRAFILGPAACQTCRRIVWFGHSTTRVEGRTVIGEARVWRDWGAHRTHQCEPKPLSKSGLYSREYRARKKNPHPMLANSRAAYEERAS